MSLRLISLLLTALVACGVCAGQTPQDETQREPRTFRITTLGKRINNASYQLQGGGQHALRLSPSYIAGPYTYSGRPINISQSAADGQTSPIALATVAQGIRNPLVLLLEMPSVTADGLPLPFTAVAIDESLQTAPPNSLRLLNLTGTNAAVSFAKGKPHKITAGNQLIIPFESPAAGDSYRTLDVALQDSNGSWQRISSARENQIYLEDGYRYLAIISPNTATTEDSAKNTADGGRQIPQATVTIICDTLSARVLKSLMPPTPH